MRDDLRELSRTIDPAVLGERIRKARLRAGLTQAALAGSVVSVGYISRIESGQRRPDAALLETIAEGLGSTPEELLLGISSDRLAEIRLQLDHAELALVTGSPASAVEQLARILAEPDIEAVPDVERRASYLQANALEATGDVQGAILALETLAETEPHDLDWINGLTSLSRCYRESGELGRAIEVGEQATKFIEERGLAGLDEAVRLTLTVAAAYMERGDLSYAARMCRRVIEQAEDRSSAIAKGSAYWNLSIAESRSGNAAIAVAMAQRALGILGSADDSRHVARLRTQLAILLLRLDPPEAVEAFELLVRSDREMAITGAGPADLADNHLAQARARLLLGDPDGATEQATETAARARQASPIVAADAFALLGQIAINADDVESARQHFQEAALLLSGVGADRSAAQLWFELAGLLERVGDAAAALDAYRRAGAATGLVSSATSVATLTT